MSHIHECYDYVVSVFIVHRKKVLLVYHKKYKEWLPIGGHVELDEDPEEALYREIKEECGLEVKILASRTNIVHPGVKPLLTPEYLDAHRITDVHKHTAFVYFGTALSDRVRLHEREHREYGWFSAKELTSSKLKLTRSIHFYCRKALEKAKKK